MRSPQYDRALTPDIPTDGTAAETRSPTASLASARRAASDAAASAERRCILTGAHGGRDTLIRLAISPDGVVVPDVLARAPGRGAWIAVDRPTLENALAKGKLKGALARAHKGASLTIPSDLPAAIEAALQRTFLAQLGMAAKAGALLTGAEKVDAAARSGAVAMLYHAADAAEDGRRKRDQSWRVGEDAEGSGQAGRILPVDRTALSVALGRDNAVHIAIIDANWASRLSALLDRWHAYATCATGSPAAAVVATRDDPPTGSRPDAGPAAV
jgi:hypothetical protein